MTFRGAIKFYGLLALALLAGKIILAQFYRPFTENPHRSGYRAPYSLRIAAVVPIYNEDPDTFERCLRSILTQSRAIDEVHVVDDASHDTSALRRAEKLTDEFAEAGIRLKISIQPVNLGKREALGVGFKAAPYADGFLCIDSDTVLDARAVEEVIKPLSDPEVNAVTGLVLALNQRKNLLTKLIDLRYGNAFLMERAGYSKLNSVLCCCGSLVVYRASVVRENLDDFLSQKFLGKPAVFGDDRRLTNYSLMNGRVLFQETAVAYTAVPERMSHFVRQQVRWNKSFFRESQWAVRKLPWSRPGKYLSFIEIATWMVFSAALVTSVFVAPLISGMGFLRGLIGYLCFTAVMSYARSARYLDFVRPGTTAIARIGIYMLAPLYGFLSMFVLLPLRLYALCTMTRGKWGTRQSGVEVSDEGSGVGTVASAPATENDRVLEESSA